MALAETISLSKRETQGVTGALPRTDIVEYCILAAGTAIAWAYTIELDLLIFYTFRRRKGLYFWSLLISSWGCSLHALGFVLKFLVGSSWLVDLPFIEIGWVAMVTGQAFVLFSRLHLVVRNQSTLRYVLYMIIFNAIVLHVPTIVFTYGSNSPKANFWAPKFNIMERIQLLGFCIQEMIISTVYIVATVRLLGSIYHSRTRKVMMQLLLINFICIGMDIVLIGLEFTNNYVGEASVKPMIYSIKLKLEFAVLNQLMGLTKAGFTEESHFNHHGHELQASRSAGGTATTAVDPEGGKLGALSARKSGGWSTAQAMRGSFSHGIAPTDGANADTDHIFQTKQVEVVTQPKSPAIGSHSDTSTSSTVVASPPAAYQGNPKAASLMGTAIVRMPTSDVARSLGSRRISRNLDPDGREPSPASEGEKGILHRPSQDSEKEGTRWIEGFER